MWDMGKTFKCEQLGRPTDPPPPALPQQQPSRPRVKRRRLGDRPLSHENLLDDGGSLDSASELEDRLSVLRETQASDPPDQNVPPYPSSAAMAPPIAAPSYPFSGVQQDAPRSVPSFHSLVQSLNSTYPPVLHQPLGDVCFDQLPQSGSTTPSRSPHTMPSFLEPPTLGPSHLEPPNVGPSPGNTALWMDTPNTFLTFDTPAQELQQEEERKRKREEEDEDGDLLSYGLVYARPRSREPRRSSRRSRRYN